MEEKFLWSGYCHRIMCEIMCKITHIASLARGGSMQSTHVLGPQMCKVKVKVPLDNFSPVVFDTRGQCPSPFPSHRASVLSEDNLPCSHGQCDLDTECCYLPTEGKVTAFRV